MTTSIDRAMAALNAKRSGVQAFHGIPAAKAIKGGTEMPGTKRGNRGGPKGLKIGAVNPKPLAKAKPTKSKQGGKPGAVQVPSNPAPAPHSVATNTEAGNPKGPMGALHIHIHTNAAGY